MRSRILLVSIVALALLPACKSQYDAIFYGSDVQAKYKMAFDLFEAKKYTKAAETFESLTMATRGTAQEDTVQFYWGLSNYRYKDFYTAETNFTKFLTNYPMSPFSDEARFLRIDCLFRSTLRYELDQTPTRTAIASINQYLSEVPEDDIHREACGKMLEDLEGRLDRKAYEAARLYYKMEDYKASRVAFRNILKDDSENIFREDILYYTAMSSYNYAFHSVASKRKERYLTFVDDYLNFIGENPESKYRKELDVMYKRSQKALGRWSGSDDDLDIKDKEFEKERKQLDKAAKKMKKAESKKNETAAGKGE